MKPRPKFGVTAARRRARPLTFGGAPAGAAISDPPWHPAVVKAPRKRKSEATVLVRTGYSSENERRHWCNSPKDKNQPRSSTIPLVLFSSANEPGRLVARSVTANRRCPHDTGL